MRIETASKLKIIVVSISVLIFSQLFIAGLSISLFQKSYLNFLTSSIELVGKEFKIEIERGIRYGKSFNKFLGMEQLMEEIKRRNKDIMNIVIFETDGKIPNLFANISRFVDRSEIKKLYVSLGGIIGGLGLTLLYFESGLLAVMFAIFILGLASSSRLLNLYQFLWIFFMQLCCTDQAGFGA